MQVYLLALPRQEASSSRPSHPFSPPMEVPYFHDTWYCIDTACDEGGGRIVDLPASGYKGNLYGEQYIGLFHSAVEVETLFLPEIMFVLWTIYGVKWRGVCLDSWDISGLNQHGISRVPISANVLRVKTWMYIIVVYRTGTRFASRIKLIHSFHS